MPSILQFVKKDFNFDKNVIKENKKQLKDPDYFQPIGIQVFFGEQGSGKTITLMHTFLKIAKRYPKAIVVSNIILKDRKKLSFNGDTQKFLDIIKNEIDTQNEYIYYSSKEEYSIVNKHVRNGKYGVILITDEYQNYFSNQDSRNVPPWVIEQAAQNRKQRRVHLVSSQDYDQIVKPIRRRSDVAFKCKTFSFPFTYGSLFTVYWGYDSKKLDFKDNGAMNALKPLKMGFFFHTVKLRNSFDTFQVVFTGDQVDGVFRSSQPTITVKKIVSPLSGKRRFSLK